MSNYITHRILLACLLTNTIIVRVNSYYSGATSERWSRFYFDSTVLSTTVSQSYTDEGNFMNIQSAFEANITENIRITLNFNLIDGEDGDKMSCKGEDYIVDPCKTFSLANSSLSSCERQCSTSEVIDEALITTVKTLMEKAKKRTASLLQLKPIQNSINYKNLSSSSLSGIGTELQTTEAASSDLEIIVTLRPDDDDISSYSYCLQRDQFNRCTVGHLNLIPSKFDKTSESVDDFAVVMHEILHLLGGITPAGEDKVNSSGGAQDTSNVSKLTYRNSVPIQKIITPNVVSKAREYFNCSTLDGVPLEDNPYGAGLHWEARVMGPDIMSLGYRTGETYISDITLAYFQDTGHYFPNYNAAGSLIIPPSENGKLLPGMLRWGKFAGCEDVSVSSTWPISTSCAKDTFTCSEDHRFATKCSSLEWGKGEYKVPEYYSCLGNRTCQTNAETPFLPFNLRLNSNSESHDGGFSASLDYIHVPLAFQSCSENTNTEVKHGANIERSLISSIRTETGDIYSSSLGGQWFGDDTRCFRSSLIELNNGLADQSLPVYGKCYKSNCYKSNYLQFGIKSSWRQVTYWYKCPEEGGKIFIPGFAGAFHCPKASDFCANDVITNVKQAETSLSTEWLYFIGGIGGFILFILFCLYLSKSTRNRFTQMLKRGFGIDVETGYAANIFVDDAKFLHEWKTRQASKVLLVVFNILFAIAGLCLIAIAVLSLPAFGINLFDNIEDFFYYLITFGCIFLIIAYFGIRVATQNKLTIKLLIYFYVCCLAVLYSIYSVLARLLFRGASTVLLNVQEEDHPEYKVIINIIQRVSTSEFATAIFISFMVYFVIGMVCSTFTISSRVILRSLLGVTNWFILFGALIFGSYCATRFWYMHSYFFYMYVVPLGLLFLNSLLGIRVSMRRSKFAMNVYLFTSLVLFALLFLVGVYIYMYNEELVKESLKQLNEDEFSRLENLLSQRKFTDEKLTELLLAINGLVACVFIVLSILQLAGFFFTTHARRTSETITQLLPPSHKYSLEEAASVKALHQSKNLTSLLEKATSNR